MPLCLSGAQFPDAGREFSHLLSVFTSQKVKIVAIIEPNPYIVMVDMVGYGEQDGGTRENEIVFLANLSLYARKTLTSLWRCALGRRGQWRGSYCLRNSQVPLLVPSSYPKGAPLFSLTPFPLPSSLSSSSSV